MVTTQLKPAAIHTEANLDQFRTMPNMYGSQRFSPDQPNRNGPTVAIEVVPQRLLQQASSQLEALVIRGQVGKDETSVMAILEAKKIILAALLAEHRPTASNLVYFRGPYQGKEPDLEDRSWY